MAKRDVPIVVCDVCEKTAKQTNAKGNWLHIPQHFAFGIKATKRPVATDLCSARCAKKWVAIHPAFDKSVAQVVEPVVKKSKRVKKPAVVAVTPEAVVNDGAQEIASVGSTV